MVDAAIALDGVSVVIKGHFNAAIFSPLWLLQQNLIGADEFTSASIEVITSDIASFSTGWLNCQVVPDTLVLNTTDPDEFERVRDVAVGILTALPHTPIAALGINRELHFGARDADQYHAIGDTLAPKDFWEDLVALPVMREIVIWGQRPDDFGGRVQVKVEPSLRIPGHVFVSHNDHFNLLHVDEKPSDRSEAWAADVEQATRLEASSDKIPLAIEILGAVWTSSFTLSDQTVNAIARIK